MPLDPVALARALVLALFPALAAAIKSGMPPREAFDRAYVEHGLRWRAEHGPDVSREAAAVLDELMAYHVMMPLGRLTWYSLGPVADLRPPAEAMPPPPEDIGRARRVWRHLWGESG